jgi:hypothetical protein
LTYYQAYANIDNMINESQSAINSQEFERNSRLSRIGHDLGNLALRLSISTAIGVGMVGIAETFTDVPKEGAVGFMAAIGAGAVSAHYQEKNKKR